MGLPLLPTSAIRAPVIEIESATIDARGRGHRDRVKGIRSFALDDGHRVAVAQRNGTSPPPPSAECMPMCVDKLPA